MNEERTGLWLRQTEDIYGHFLQHIREIHSVRAIRVRDSEVRMYVIRETYTSAGGLLDLDGVIRTVVSVSSLTWFIRYQIIIYEDYIFSPSWL
jgi:hypothetical protein